MAAHSISTCTCTSIRRAGPAAAGPRRNTAAVYTVVVITDILERSWTNHAWWSEADLSLVPVVVYEGCGEICVFLSWGVHLPPNKHVRSCTVRPYFSYRRWLASVPSSAFGVVLWLDSKFPQTFSLRDTETFRAGTNNCALSFCSSYDCIHVEFATGSRRCGGGQVFVE